MDSEIIAKLQDILQNPETADGMTKEELLALMKKSSPCGAVLTADKSYINISLINYREEWLRKFLTTALVGFQYRLLSEYEAPESDDCRQGFVDAGLSEEQIKKCLRVVKDNAKPQIRRFLDRNFNFDPDRHVHSSYKENTKDPSRVAKYTAYRAAMETAKAAPVVSEEMARDPSATLAFSSDCLTRTYNLAEASSKLLTNFLKLVNGQSTNDMSLEDLVGIAAKYAAKFRELRAQVEPMAKAIVAKNVVTAYAAEPPMDVFYHLNRYISNNYEQLREACEVLHVEKPDVEYAVQYYDTFTDLAGAQRHQKKHENSVVAPIITIENGGWTIMGPFKENRDKVSMYNKNTAIFEAMMQQAEQDVKLGKDILEKKVKAKKAENIEQMGLDDPGLARYSEALGTIETLGAKRVLDDADKRKLHDAVRTKEQAEVPADGIQVDVFGANAKGEFTRDKFYSKAEAPTKFEENVEELKSQLLVSGKKLVSRHGDVADVAHLRKG